MTNHNHSWLKNVLATLFVAGTFVTFSACAEEDPDVDMEVDTTTVVPIEPLPMDTTMMDTTMMDTTGMIE